METLPSIFDFLGGQSVAWEFPSQLDILLVLRGRNLSPDHAVSGLPA